MTEEPKPQPAKSMMRGLRRHLLPYVSGSSMPQADKCASSLTLPGVGRILESGADVMGTAIHEHLKERNRMGVDEAMARIPLLVKRYHLDEEQSGILEARCRSFQWSPPRDSVAELPLCLFEDGHVEPVQGGQGYYAALDDRPDALLPCQIDLFWAEPEPLYKDAQGRVRCPPESVLWVVDFKSGREDNVEPAATNLQLLAGCVLAARYTGAKRAIPAAVFIRRGQGIWDTADEWFGERELDAIEKRLRAVVQGVRENRRAYAAGELLSYRVGAHCRRCSARPYCEAHLNEVKMFLDDPTPLRDRSLSEHEIVRLAGLQPSIQRFADSVRQYLRDWTELHGPIVLPGGEHWGPVEVKKDRLNPDLAIEMLASEIGDEPAQLGREIEINVTKASIERAIKSEHALLGIQRKLAPTMRMVMGKLKGAGGIESVSSVEFRLHRPKAAPPPDTAPAPLLLEGPIDGDPE